MDLLNPLINKVTIQGISNNLLITDLFFFTPKQIYAFIFKFKLSL